MFPVDFDTLPDRVAFIHLNQSTPLGVALLVQSTFCLVSFSFCFEFDNFPNNFVTLIFVCVLESLLRRTSSQTLRPAYEGVSLVYLSRTSDRVIELKGPVGPHCRAVVFLLPWLLDIRWYFRIIDSSSLLELLLCFVI